MISAFALRVELLAARRGERDRDGELEPALRRAAPGAPWRRAHGERHGAAGGRRLDPACRRDAAFLAEPSRSPRAASRPARLDRAAHARALLLGGELDRRAWSATAARRRRPAASGVGPGGRAPGSARRVGRRRGRRRGDDRRCPSSSRARRTRTRRCRARRTCTRPASPWAAAPGGRPVHDGFGPVKTTLWKLVPAG